MLPPAFEYSAPRTLSEAIGLLQSGGEGAKVIAGGQSLIPLLKLRLASPTHVVDIGRLPGMDYIRESDGVLRIGALTRMADVQASDLLKRKYAAIHDASTVIGDPLVRNLGTIGGNLSHGDPTNDMPAVMLALGGEFAVAGPSGGRTIPADGFFIDTFSVALKHDEILTEVRVPAPPPRSGGSYVKFEQKVADFATAAAAAYLTRGQGGECLSAGIGLTAVGPTAIKARKAEESLRGVNPFDGGAISRAAKLAADASDPSTDIRGTATYKRKLVEMLVARALRTAYLRAMGRGAK